MKKLFYILLCLLFIISCSSSEKTANQHKPDKLIGENEMLVLKQLGTPSQVIQTRSGKVLLYENRHKGTFLSPKKSNLSIGNEGWTYTSNVNKAANKSQFTINSHEITTLRVYINDEGTCVKIEQAPPGEYGEMYHERFKHFNKD